MTASPLGVGIHGAGNVSTQYIDAFRRNPHTVVRMLTSRTAASARRRADAQGLDCEVGDSLEAILGRDDVQIVVLATPNHLHAAEAVRAARAGRHLVVEKPIATTAETLAAVVEAVEAAAIVSQVGFVLRWNPMVELARRLARDGTLGDLVLAEADYVHRIDPSRPGASWKAGTATSGGALLMGGCHAIDALRYCAGEIVSVSAYAGRRTRPDLEYPATITAALEFAGGAVGKLGVTFDAHTPYLFNLHLYGSRGTLRNNRLYAQRLAGQTGYTEIPLTVPDSGEVTHHPFREEVDDLVDAILHRRATRCPVSDAALSHAVCLAIDRSWREGRRVDLPAVPA